MTTGVTVKADGVMKDLAEMGDLISGKRRDIMKYGRAVMRQETRSAFVSKVDPTTRRPWAPRKGAYPWPLLYNTGDLYGSLGFGYGIKTKDRKLRLFGKVRGGQSSIVRAGAVHFGRSTARSSRGTRLRNAAPATGATPARPIFGFGRSAQKRIKRYAEKRLARAFK